MIVNTHSGPIKGNKRNRYMQFLAGYCSTGAWSGNGTINDVQNTHETDIEGASGPKECYRLGVAVGRQKRYHELNPSFID